ncbi:MAG: hypothetical protein ACTHLA_06205 [Asticcacaulis sp.]|uniref:hypothetical protein n=1 Tax=Asticcacaulis sp. TaxID=1872648 RepID=UPI003F7B3CFF
MAMTSDARKDQPNLTPEQRREMLRAFADRMLVKISAMDDPEDLPGVERAVRTAAVIERLYSRCDRAEHHGPDPRKLRAERAQNEGDALRAQVALAGTLKWSEERRRDLGPWWDEAGKAVATPTPVERRHNPSPLPSTRGEDGRQAEGADDGRGAQPEGLLADKAQPQPPP